MSLLDFIASIVGSLAWPVAVVLIALLFREQLARVLLTLTRVKYKDVEIDFGRELEKANQEAKELDVQRKLPAQKPTLTGEKKTDSLLTEAASLAAEFPEPAVAVAWTAIEHEIMQAVMRLAISPDYPPYNSTIKNIQLLHEDGVIDDATVKLLDRMRRLRNVAVHRAESRWSISPDEAREFIALAQGIVEKVEQLKR